MSDRSHPNLFKIFEAAAELPPDRRDAFLREQCGEDDALRAEVEALLRHDESSPTEFLQSPVLRTQANPRLPATIGRYKVTGFLGSGGMGVVYEGAQSSPRRVVAIKVIRAEMLSDRLLARFHNEAEILGRLEHPGIARIYEAGMAAIDGTPGECPFFAMELVHGIPLLEYAADKSTADQLRLFAEVCAAVHHAHQKGVIHRDLKPANILVTPEGQPKVLDFGVARATDGDIQAVTMQTEIGQILGTLPYMSPEQLAGDLGRLDTRSDVYSLGVVLFELLTGEFPHDIRESSVPEAARIIRDENIMQLSTLVPSLRGDLEWVIAKALEKNIERRYDSASAFAADIHRHLNDEPVLAGPPSASYRLRKFVRRNKVGVGWAAAVAILLIAGLTTTIALTVRATSAERSARSALESWRRESDRGYVSADFLVWALAIAAPEDGDAIRRTLDAASARIEDRFGANPATETDVRRMMGDVYGQIGAYAPAREQLLVAYAMLKDSSDPSEFVEQGLVEVLVALQSSERELGNGEEAAIRWYMESLAILEQRADRNDPAIAHAMRNMRRDLMVQDTAPPREVRDRHLELVMAAYKKTPRPDDVGQKLALYLMYMMGYVANVFGEPDISYAKAQIEILDGLERPSAARQLGVALWLEARFPAASGDEERRVAIARRLVDEHFGYAGWWPYDYQGILGEALVERGRDEDQAEITRRLVDGNRGLRQLRSTDTAAHLLLETRRGYSLLRLVAFGYDDRVVHLVDQPEILDELAAGIEEMSMPVILTMITESMTSRQGRGDRWYDLASRAEERVSVLFESDFSIIDEKP